MFAYGFRSVIFLSWVLFSVQGFLILWLLAAGRVALEEAEPSEEGAPPVEWVSAGGAGGAAGVI